MRLSANLQRLSLRKADRATDVTSLEFQQVPQAQRVVPVCGGSVIPAGPAFEGARIKQGMRAAVGAIDHVQIDDDVTYSVIGDVMPKSRAAVMTSCRPTAHNLGR